MKFEVGTLPPQEQYTKLLVQEISQKQHVIPKHDITSIYFGGGTPSLMLPSQIQTIIETLRSSFSFSQDNGHDNVEITLEINPGTINEAQLKEFLAVGVNRFSVGVQTFNEELLKVTGRKHSVLDSIQTLELLKKFKVNYSLDILYALPHQTSAQLKEDLILAGSFEPSHVSCYYLTVPQGHPLNQNRSSDEDQEKMMDLLEEVLSEFGIHRYEISNYSKKGKESRHNLIYWKDKPYWGIGMGAHSFLGKEENSWGVRFWNPSTYKSYENYLAAIKNIEKSYQGLNEASVEVLEKHQALTDYTHTFLRCLEGFDLEELEKKFHPTPAKFYKSLEKLLSRNLLEKSQKRFRLTTEGRKLTNLVFEEFTFLKTDLNP